jgi:leucyl-tRNA synthetase
MMELTNTLSKFKQTDGQSMALRLESLDIILRALSPITPHLCHHLWQQLGHQTAIINESWPEVDNKALEQDEVQIIVQVNGKVRAKITVSADASKASIEALGLNDENVLKFTEGNTVRKVIYIPGKLLNIVAN